ncbi:MAG: HAMP domain-containing histidine kinase [Tannerella sp.]|jgi:signal transduction histidine kinase|nr:HAMP domain-containing histidine kinase [Tannerella sp.]
MKKNTLFLSFIICFNTIINAQDHNLTSASLKEQAYISLNNGKYTEARSLYKKACEGFAARGDYLNAVECGLKADSLYVKEYFFKEAFELCRNMDAIILKGEEKENKKLFDLRLLIVKERLRIYMILKNAERAKEQLAIMDEISRQAKNETMNETILNAKANYYFTFGSVAQGINYYDQLINFYHQKGDTEKVAECLKNIATLAEKSNNASLATGIYKQYITWNDSLNRIAATNKLIEIKQIHDETQNLLKKKEDDLSSKQRVIVTLCVLIIILIAALSISIIILLRFVAIIKKQKNNVKIIGEYSQSKSRLLQNISTLMAPALDLLAAYTAKQISGEANQQEKISTQIDSLRRFYNDIQELSLLENSLDEPYELINYDVTKLCKDVANKARPHVKQGVDFQVNAFKIEIKMNPEQLDRILTHLLKNAAFHTETGKISLDFKKKGAHIHEFIVTDTGCGIPEELRENIFKPFTEIKDLTKGDGLGLPICSLIAKKMNGELTLNMTKTGSQFVLKLYT